MSDCDFVIEKLDDFDRLRNFFCGVPQMDDFIHGNLKRCNDNHYCTTFVVTEGQSKDVVALFALSFDSVNLDSDDFEDIHTGTSGTDLMDVDDVFREDFEQKYTYPALEIAYIAVRKDRRGENIGIDLVNEIAEWAKKQDMAGCVFLTVNALHTKEYSAVRFYEKCKFAKLTPVPQMDVWPMFKTLWIKEDTF